MKLFGNINYGIDIILPEISINYYHRGLQKQLNTKKYNRLLITSEWHNINFLNSGI